MYAMAERCQILKNISIKENRKMKSTGIVRRVDELGRIVLPIELRNKMDIKTRDSVEIFVDGDKIVLKKYSPSCIFCGNAEDVFTYEGKLICRNCLEAMTHAAEE